MTTAKSLYLVVPPELCDDTHWTPVPLEDAPTIVRDAIQAWIEGCDPKDGDVLTLRVRAMTDDEYDSLPEL